MARKKVVFVIVEGPSDDTALGVLLNRLYDKNEVHIEIMHGDITTNRDVSPTNIPSVIGNLVRNYATNMSFSQKDFQQVIHLVDMDGAYIPHTVITNNPNASKPIYSPTAIQTADPEKLVERNLRKQRILNRICRMKRVWDSIPYSVYYMSCNLDHVLYNKQNSSDEEKEDDAYVFAKRYKDDVDGFLAFITESEFCRTDGYDESWNFIKKDLHSLERHTNLGLCFADIRTEHNADTYEETCVSG